MNRHAVILMKAAVLALTICGTVASAHAAVIRAKVQDIDGKPVMGVKIFLYESNNVRKPADFISASTDKNGIVAVTVPTGKYWAVARLKKDVFYGPLMPGDKHSGEPSEVEISDTQAAEIEFVVADIREVGQKKRTGNADLIRLWGRILDKDGNPLADAYVFAMVQREAGNMPDYLSAWTDESGRYSLYLPSGSVSYVGGSRQFPPEARPSNLKVFDTGSANLNIASDIQLIVY